MSNLAEEIESKAKPFVKWVGGKSQLKAELVARVPKFNRYFEPFIGGGALFFELLPELAFISDVNPELINCYRVIKNNPSALIENLAEHRYESEYYYQVRNVDRTSEYSSWTDVQRASRFIFLNKTCFNGLYRVNSRGEFNVPFGKYVNPNIINGENILACSKALSQTEISLGPFLEIERKIAKGDFVYFDPPYVPLNTTSSFTSYTKDGFGIEMQTELAELCKRLDNKGVKFMTSNSDTSLVREIYQDFKLETVQASRAINSNSAKRGKIAEILVTNF